MLGSPILYLKGMRLMMFQLSGFYYKTLSLLEAPSSKTFPPPQRLLRPQLLEGEAPHRGQRGSTHRPHSSSFLGLPNPKKELLWGLWLLVGVLRISDMFVLFPFEVLSFGFGAAVSWSKGV